MLSRDHSHYNTGCVIAAVVVAGRGGRGCWGGVHYKFTLNLKDISNFTMVYNNNNAGRRQQQQQPVFDMSVMRRSMPSNTTSNHNHHPRQQTGGRGGAVVTSYHRMAPNNNNSTATSQSMRNMNVGRRQLPNNNHAQSTTSAAQQTNPSWLGSNPNQYNDVDNDDDDDDRTMATSAFALRPSSMAKAKDMTYPQGDVTIIYTDVQGSTSFWETCPSDMKTATDIHDRIMRQCYTDHSGYEITTEGDAFNLAFQHPADALAFALQAQLKLYKADWPRGILNHPDGRDEPAFKFRGFRVRFGIHHGPTTSRTHEATGRIVYSGIAVKIAKAVEGMCHGGQILTTMETWKAVSGMAERYLGRPQVLDCGEHLLFETKVPTTTRYTRRINSRYPNLFKDPNCEEEDETKNASQ